MSKLTIAEIHHNNRIQSGMSILKHHMERQRIKRIKLQEDIDVYSKSESEVYKAKVISTKHDIKMSLLYGEGTNYVIETLGTLLIKGVK